MTRTLRIALIAAAALLLASGAALAFLLQDANRYKPHLETLIAERTGAAVEIAGDLHWRLWPPLSLRAEKLRADREDHAWTAESVTVNFDLFEILRAPARWEIQSAHIAGLVLDQGGSVLEVKRARLDGLAADRPAALRADLALPRDDGPPMPVQVTGQIRLDPETNGVEFLDTQIDSALATGVCNAHASNGPQASLNWRGNCLLDWLAVAERRFEQVDFRFAGAGSEGDLAVAMPEFFGGSAHVDIRFEAAEDPVRWTVVPTLTAVDSAALLTWLDQGLEWAAPLAYGGTLTLEGNSREELVGSLSGETRFDGGQGRINIAGIRQQLMSLAALFNEGDRIERWPEVWEYQRLVGDWHIDRQRHRLDLALDNLIVTGAGDYHPPTDEIDMRFELVFQNDPQWPVFQVHPMLLDLPIPLRCRGALRDPECRIDGGAARRIVARALASEDDSLRVRMEQKIDTDVPAEYREAARTLLDLFGGSRQGRTDRDRNRSD
jgi:hypothetical protein